ncbi:CAP-Gly domain protein [Borborobacter arsenicus]|uniref:CAP-Gly domain protein n=1 Tax=Borborobacter arsenicus TaxID=1851146 RepID=UPI001AEC8605|nr:CAP-Gly domain protein [Pseudaminobacter arsenicus]
MTYNFHAGMDVVCIDDNVPLAGGGVVKDANITEGETYRLRWVGMASHYVFGDYLGVKLEGVDSKFGEAWGVPDAPYAARRFRPLVKDPIALFRRIATDPDYKIDAPEGPVRDEPLPPEKAPKREKEVV